MRLPRNRRGQIVIPAMLMFPTLFLFVYLIFETSKVSKAKIAHQFAIDAAAFVEMTNYSDFMNRTAYVNGAFPMRIFEEGYGDFQAVCDGKASKIPCVYTVYGYLLFNNGAFPHIDGQYTTVAGHPGEQSISGGQWKIEYGGTGGLGPGKNSNPPTIPEPFQLFTEDNSDNFWLMWDLSTDIYKLYVQIYSLLGSVEGAQLQVLQRLTTSGGTPHSFMAKSYWLNTGDPVGDAKPLTDSFTAALGDFTHAVHPKCIHSLTYWGNIHKSGGFQPFVPNTTKSPVDLTKPPLDNQICDGENGAPGDGGGLFQIEYVDPPMLKTLQNGLVITMPWSIPQNNFFNVDLKAAMDQAYPGRELHTTVSLIGDSHNTPAVWPDPTPKFQVRQFP